jgi:hypothetical protein
VVVLLAAATPNPARAVIPGMIYRVRDNIIISTDICFTANADISAVMRTSLNGEFEI